MDLNAFISDPNLLPWLIPVGPLLAFLIITLLTNRSHLIPATSEEYGGHHPDYEGMLVPVVTDRSRVVSVIIGMIGILLAWAISAGGRRQRLRRRTSWRKRARQFGDWFDTG